MSDVFSSNISPSEMAEMNMEDAKQIDVALGVIINEMPSRIAFAKNMLDDVATSIKSLKTLNLGFNINGEVENLAKDFDTFSQEVINNASYYELNIVKIIDIFDRQNSLDGSSTIDNNYFKSLPFLGAMLLTVLKYATNTRRGDLAPQIAVDVSGNWMDRDFNEAIGAVAYNATEWLPWSSLGKNGVAVAALITVESLYDYLKLGNKDPRNVRINLINAAGDGVKLLGGNLIADYVAVDAGTAVSTWVATKLAGFGGAKVAGGLAGGAVGVGIVVLGEVTIDLVVSPLVDEITGESFVYMTSIQKNGGERRLYSNYVNQIQHSYISPLGITTSLDGITVSPEYCHEMAQIDPVGTLLGLDEYGYSETSYSTTQLESYISDLKAIPKDSPNFQEQVDQLTANALIGDGSGYGTDYIRDLLYDLDFDPYSYAINN